MHSGIVPIFPTSIFHVKIATSHLADAYLASRTLNIPTKSATGGPSTAHNLRRGLLTTNYVLIERVKNNCFLARLSVVTDVIQG